MNYKNFRNYLQEKGFAESCIVNHELNLKRFENWCKTGDYKTKKITYQELLKYLKYLLDKEVGKSTIKNYINSIKKYYDYLLEIKVLETNPAKEINIRNPERKVLQDVLSQEELERIYHDYLNSKKNLYDKYRDLKHKRNIVILGLMIYQGLHVGEIKKLEQSYLKLDEGTIYIPSGRRSNSRILKLEAKQIFPIMIYIKETRAELLKIQQVKTDKLFFGKHKLYFIIESLMKRLKNEYSFFKGAGQIRSSVIMNWLNHNNIRQVQYMAGHKYISATERYKKEDLKDLQKQLEMFHPLK